MKTKLGIEYDIKVIEKVKGGVVIRTACENGEREDKINMSMDDYQELTEEKLLEEVEYLNLEDWVNKTETEYFVKWFNDYCVKNSCSESFYSVSFSYFEWFSVQLYKSQPIDNGTGIRDFKAAWFENAIGVDEINNLILKLKNK